jgi:uncharacterized protein (TIGR03435 family)
MNKVFAALFLIAATANCRAQEFEVAAMGRTEPASMKNMDSGKNIKVWMEPTILRMRGVTLAETIRWAYDLKAYQLVGTDGKPWDESVGMQRLYYIEGQFPEHTSHKDVKAMLQTLLNEKIGLVCHSGKPEIKMNQAKVDPKGISDSLSLTPDPPPQTGEIKPDNIPGSKAMQMVGTNVTMGQIIDEVSRMARIPVVDSTGLGDTRYNIKRWIIDFSDLQSAVGIQDIILGSLSQLGITVSTGKSSVQVLVVDSISNKLAEN